MIGGKDRWEQRLAGLETELLIKRKEIAEDDESGPSVWTTNSRPPTPARVRASTIGRLARFRRRAHGAIGSMCFTNWRWRGCGTLIECAPFWRSLNRCVWWDPSILTRFLSC